MSKNYVVFITPRCDNYCFNFVTFNYKNGAEVPCQTREIKDLLKFFENPPEFVKTSVKAIVCNIYGFVKNGALDHDFCHKLSTKLSTLKIPFRFISNLIMNSMCGLIGAKINQNRDEKILQIFVQGNILKIVSLSRQENGYAIMEVQETRGNYETVIQMISETNPQKVIISDVTRVIPYTEMFTLKLLLNRWKPIELRHHISKYLFECVKAIVNNLFDDKLIKYIIIPQCLDRFGITFNESNPVPKEDILISTDGDELLPLSKSLTVSRFHKKFYITSQPGKICNVIHKPFEAIEEAHRIKLTLSVDLNNSPTINQEPILLSKISKMAKKLNPEKTEKLPVIGFFDNSSVICIWDEENNRYNFCEAWNEKFGKELFLDFLLPKPALVGSSTEVTSLNGAVYDLVKVMTMLPTEIKHDKSWKFAFTKDAENPILLEFDTFENERKQSSPSFLMAMMLKEHLKVIKKEIGKKSKKIGIRLLDDFDSPETRKRVESCFEEACEKIKIGVLLV